ncbi:unnamed protein product [Amoebophrya sp. A120]|nr:unnamed protein product [Amoebophrya sp. A120]|eukprot:GSA120T00007812001.1
MPLWPESSPCCDNRPSSLDENEVRVFRTYRSLDGLETEFGLSILSVKAAGASALSSPRTPTNLDRTVRLAPSSSAVFLPPAMQSTITVPLGKLQPQPTIMTPRNPRSSATAAAFGAAGSPLNIPQTPRAYSMPPVQQTRTVITPRMQQQQQFQQGGEIMIPAPSTRSRTSSPPPRGSSAAEAVPGVDMEDEEDAGSTIRRSGGGAPAAAAARKSRSSRSRRGRTEILLDDELENMTGLELPTTGNRFTTALSSSRAAGTTSSVIAPAPVPFLSSAQLAAAAPEKVRSASVTAPPVISMLGRFSSPPPTKWMVQSPRVSFPVAGPGGGTTPIITPRTPREQSLDLNRLSLPQQIVPPVAQPTPQTPIRTSPPSPPAPRSTSPSLLAPPPLQMPTVQMLWNTSNSLNQLPLGGTSLLQPYTPRWAPTMTTTVRSLVNRKNYTPRPRDVDSGTSINAASATAQEQCPLPSNGEDFWAWQPYYQLQPSPSKLSSLCCTPRTSVNSPVLSRTPSPPVLKTVVGLNGFPVKPLVQQQQRPEQLQNQSAATSYRVDLSPRDFVIDKYRDPPGARARLARAGMSKEQDMVDEEIALSRSSDLMKDPASSSGNKKLLNGEERQMLFVPGKRKDVNRNIAEDVMNGKTALATSSKSRGPRTAGSASGASRAGSTTRERNSSSSAAEKMKAAVAKRKTAEERRSEETNTGPVSTKERKGKVTTSSTNKSKTKSGSASSEAAKAAKMRAIARTVALMQPGAVPVQQNKKTATPTPGASTPISIEEKNSTPGGPATPRTTNWPARRAASPTLSSALKAKARTSAGRGEEAPTTTAAQHSRLRSAAATVVYKARGVAAITTATPRNTAGAVGSRTPPAPEAIYSSRDQSLNRNSAGTPSTSIGPPPRGRPGTGSTGTPPAAPAEQKPKPPSVAPQFSKKAERSALAFAKKMMTPVMASRTKASSISSKSATRSAAVHQVVKNNNKQVLAPPAAAVPHVVLVPAPIVVQTMEMDGDMKSNMTISEEVQLLLDENPNNNSETRIRSQSPPTAATMTQSQRRQSSSGSAVVPPVLEGVTPMIPPQEDVPFMTNASSQRIEIANRFSMAGPAPLPPPPQRDEIQASVVEVQADEEHFSAAPAPPPAIVLVPPIRNLQEKRDEMHQVTKRNSNDPGSQLSPNTATHDLLSRISNANSSLLQKMQDQEEQYAAQATDENTYTSATGNFKFYERAAPTCSSSSSAVENNSSASSSEEKDHALLHVVEDRGDSRSTVQDSIRPTRAELSSSLHRTAPSDVDLVLPFSKTQLKMSATPVQWPLRDTLSDTCQHDVGDVRGRPRNMSYSHNEKFLSLSNSNFASAASSRFSSKNIPIHDPQKNVFNGGGKSNLDSIPEIPYIPVSLPSTISVIPQNVNPVVVATPRKKFSFLSR